MALFSLPLHERGRSDSRRPEHALIEKKNFILQHRSPRDTKGASRESEEYTEATEDVLNIHHSASNLHSMKVTREEEAGLGTRPEVIL